MSLTAAASGFVVVLLSVQVSDVLCVTVIQGQYGWGVTYSSTEICASKGSTVDMSCTYRYPFWKNDLKTEIKERFWFTKLSGNQPLDMKADSDYQDRVEYSCSEKSCSLRIRDLRESDSAEYKFRFITNQPGGRYTGEPGVTLRVTDLQVKVSTSTLSPWKYLECHSSCRLPDRSSYIWYKNGQKIPSQTSSTYSFYALQVQVTRITVHQSDTEAELKCHSSCSPAARLSYVWFKNGQKVTGVETSSFKGRVYPGDIICCALKGHENYGSPPVFSTRRSLTRFSSMISSLDSHCDT
ncbi:uncharacterized protein AB9X84_010460 [Acanthopagrus schlegelii]